MPHPPSPARDHPGRLRGRPIACALIAIAVLAPSPAEAEPRSFWGVSSQTALGAGDFARMGEAEVGTLRALFSWSTVEPVPGACDWSAIDAIVAEAAANEIAVLPFLYGTPDWVAHGLDRRPCAGDCAVYPPHSDAALLSWRRFVGDAVRRYGPGGEFWAQRPSLPKRPIFAWQIWNSRTRPTSLPRGSRAGATRGCSTVRRRRSAVSTAAPR